MKKSFGLIVSASLFFVSATSFAACDGFYLGVQGGSAKTHYDKEYQPRGIVEKVNQTDTGPVGRVFWGYQWTRCAALELGYAKIKYRHSHNRNLDSSYGILRPIVKETDTITDLVLRGTFPLGCRAGIFAKVGGAYTNVDFKHARDKSRACPTYGAGLTFDVSPKVPLEVSWTQVHSSKNIGTINMVTVGVSYHFG